MVLYIVGIMKYYTIKNEKVKIYCVTLLQSLY